MREQLSARRGTSLVVAAMLAAAVALAGGASAMGHAFRRTGAMGHRSRMARDAHGHQFINRIFATGDGIVHSTPSGDQQISQPDDITHLGRHIYVGFQNGVGPQGQPSATGNQDSTIVEFDLRGRPVNEWDVVGKCDGLTADPMLGRIIATVNEDANSSLYLIDPHAGVTHYRYNAPPPSNGGTDAITIYRGLVLISGSAPGTTGAAAPQPNYPAVYRAVFDTSTRVVTLQAVFYGEDQAALANVDSPQYGMPEELALTDPDSNEKVPAFAERFAGDFMLTSQGDQEQIFVRHVGRLDQTLSVLQLSSAVDDTAWPSERRGALFATDHDNNTIDEITGPFERGSVLVADTPCDESSAPSTCPAPGFPANYLGRLNPYTGAITPVAVQGPDVQPQGMLFLPESGRPGGGRWR